MGLYIMETFIEASSGIIFGETDLQETEHTTIEDLLQGLIKQYGEPAGKYVDKDLKQLGWVFTTEETADQQDWESICHEVPECDGKTNCNTWKTCPHLRCTQNIFVEVHTGEPTIIHHRYEF